MRLIQLIDKEEENIGLYNFPDDVKDEEIKLLYKEYSNKVKLKEYGNDFDEDFEGYLEDNCPQMQGERVFVNEIYV